MRFHRSKVEEMHHTAPDLQGDELGELCDIIKFTLQHDNVSAFTRSSGVEYRRLHYIDTHSNSDFILRDNVTGFFLKATSDESAITEFETMNYLSGALLQKGIGISAVRHAYIAIPKNKNQPTISVIEPAAGRTLDDIYPYKSKEKGYLERCYQKGVAERDATTRLDDALGAECRRALASDLHSGNILRNDSGLYTIIDQPDPVYGYEALAWTRNNT